MTAPAPDPAADVSTDLPPSKGAFKVLFFIVLVDMIGFGIILPILPVYARDFDASTLQITLLMSAYSLCQFIATPILGSFSDRVGRRPILIYSQIGSGLASITLAIATYWMTHSMIGLVVVYASRFVDGFSGGNLSAAQAYVSDTVAPQHKSKFMGMLGAAFGIGFALGPAIGGVLGHFSPALAPAVAACFSLTAAFLTFRILPESLKAPVVHPQGHVSRSIALLRNPVLAQINVIWFLAMFAFVTAESVFALFMTDDFHFNTAQVGGMFTLAGVVIILVQGRLIGPLTRKLGEWNLAAAGPFVFTCAMLLFAWATHVPLLWLLVIAVICNAVGRSLQTPSLSALISHHAPPGQQGAVFGLFQGFGSLARVAGPALAGFLYDHKHGYPYIMAGTLTLIAGLWTLGLKASGRASRVAAPAVAV